MLFTPPQAELRTRAEVLRDAAEAKRLMESPLLKTFFDGARTSLALKFIGSTSPEERELLFAEARGIERLRLFVAELADGEKIIEAEVAREDRARELQRQDPTKRN